MVGMTLSLMYIVQTNICNKSKLVLCKPLAYVPLRYASVIQVGAVYMGIVCISICIKEALAWTANKWTRVIIKIILFKAVIPLTN